MKILIKILRKINDCCTSVERKTLIITSFFLTSLTLVSVFNRYFIKLSMAWCEETIIALYMLLVFWGASNVAKDNAHLRMDILDKKLKGKVSCSYLNLFIAFTCLTVSIVGVYFGMKMSLTITSKTVSLSIPNSIILFFTIVLGFFALTLRYLYKFVVSLDKLKKKSGLRKY